MKPYRYETEEPLVIRRDINFFPQNLSQRGWGFTAHFHTAVEVLFFRKGAMRILSEGEEFVAGPGATVLIRSNTGHTGEVLSEEGCEYRVLKIKPSYLYDISFRDRSSRYLLDFTLNRAGKKILWTAEESEHLGITHAVEELIRESEEMTYGYDIAMKVHASAILLALLRSMQKIPAEEGEGEQAVRTIYDTLLYLNEHYGEDITAEACAERSYLSYSYFSRTFRKVTGKTFREYLNTLRIERAERELVSSHKPITRVASDCGFNNVAYFISVFRKQKNTTPLAFRKAYQTNSPLPKKGGL